MEADKLEEQMSKPERVGGWGDEEYETTDSDLTPREREAVERKVQEMRNDPNDPMNQMRLYKQTYPDLKEDELRLGGNLKSDEVHPVIIRARCPKCGEEIISKSPVMFIPYTGEKVCKHDCPRCGAKYNLENAYPRVAYIDADGNEVKAFGQ